MQGEVDSLEFRLLSQRKNEPEVYIEHLIRLDKFEEMAFYFKNYPSIILEDFWTEELHQSMMSYLETLKT